MAHISLEDIRQMAGRLGMTAGDISRPVTLDDLAANCNRCGACCKTQNGIILSLEDIFRIAGRLQTTPKRFFRHYCRESAGIIDTFGTGPHKGLLIATKNGVCPFFKAGAGCTINDVKPVTCQLYPFNSLNVTRICLLKMQREKDGEEYKGCYVFDLPRNALALPDFEALAANHIRLYITREFLAGADGRWQQGLAEKARDDCAKLSRDNKLVGQYAQLMQAAFTDLDKRNAEMLGNAIKESSGHHQ